jgi:hypothetical protein
MRFLFFLSALLMFGSSFAQTSSTKQAANSYIQFSGVVLDQDSLTPIPFVSILVKGTNRGVVSDYYGFFSMVINPGDELEFYSISHKRRNYKIADTLQNKYYYAIQVLTKDTIQLQTVDVYPWPTKEEFRRAFLALNLSDSDAERADKNLLREELSYLERTQGASASENYKYAMQAYYTKVYTAGQQPSFTLLNPVKWAEFIEAWRSGKLSGKSKTK